MPVFILLGKSQIASVYGFVPSRIGSFRCRAVAVVSAQAMTPNFFW